MPAIGAAVIAGAFAAANAAIIGASFGAALLAGGITFGVSVLQSVMNRPKTPDFVSQSNGRTVQVRQAITTRKILYGEVRVSGPVIFVTSTSSKKYFHIIIPLAGHEVAGIDEVWINDQVVPNDWLDANGNVTQGRYAGYMRIKKFLGTEGQLADPNLVAEVPNWTANHRGRGVAGVYVRMTYNRDAYPTGTPNVSAVVRGKKLFDPRNDETKWGMNIALMGRDYVHGKYGLGVAAADIDDVAIIASANNCDEMVAVKERNYTIKAVSGNLLSLEGATLEIVRGDRGRLHSTGDLPSGISAGTDYFAVPIQYGQNPRIALATSLDNAMAGNYVALGTGHNGALTFRVNAEPRYHGGGIIDRGRTRGENLTDILTGMGATYCAPGGHWKLHSAMYRPPVMELTESDCRRAMTIDPWRSRISSFNSVKGIFNGPINFWQSSDYPEVSIADYVEQDGGEKAYSELPLPFTPRPTTAQRLAKIKIEQNRREQRVNFPATLRSLPLEPTDTITITRPKRGWDGKVFEVYSRQRVADKMEGAQVWGVDLVLDETDANVYAWHTDYERPTSAAPRTEMPNPFVVSAVVGLAVNSFPIETVEGDLTFRIVPSWTLHSDVFVQEGGYIQIRYKKSDSAVWIPVGGRIEGYETQADAFSASLGATYDLSIRAFNRLGVGSAWQTISGFVAGSSGGVGGTRDYGLFSNTLTGFQDYGSFADAPAAFTDFGTF